MLASGDYARIHAGKHRYLISQRMHALERLLESGEQPLMQRRHAVAVLALVEQAEHVRVEVGGGEAALVHGLAGDPAFELTATYVAADRRTSDFAAPDVPLSVKAVFVHELTPVRADLESIFLQLTKDEASAVRSQTATTETGRGGRRYAPYVFTEQGVAMLSSVLRSQRAVAVNIEIMRAFVRLRQMMSTQADLVRRLDELEGRYDGQFKAVFDALRRLMTPPEGPNRRIGFTEV